MTNSRYIYLTLSVAIIGFTLLSCNDSKQLASGKRETALAGAITVVCDPEIISILGPAKVLYDKEHPDAFVTLVSMNVTDALNKMLNHQERIAIIARGYTPSEDSSIANDPSDTLPRALLARDALVFFVAKDFPYDTMNADHIKQWLRGEIKVRSSYPKLSKDPTFVVSGGSSGSVYANIVGVVLKGLSPDVTRLASLPTHGSVVNAVSTNISSIGVGYLSQIVRDSTVKVLRLSYTNGDGTHEWPKPVHVSYLIMGKYPFPVPIYVYLRDKPNQYNLPSGFMQFITRNAAVMKSILDAGIEPAYGKFSLVTSED